jgi:ATP-dependent RNA helicase DDX10/DBP4
MVCTPGRLLQHLEQTPTLDTSALQVLILDEADRLLDMGFKDQLSQIVNYLPTERQTLLFSATQTKSVKALARISLKQPEYISVVNYSESQTSDDKDEALSEKKEAASILRSVPTPANLMQAYTVCQLPEKIDVLYSFIRSHIRSKVIVFFSSCKQVKFVDAAFCKLRPGIPLMCMHGKMKQQKRMMVYYDFIKKPAAVLFATDIAARGLDFPSVDWVLQMDCPEDVSGYIHRVGRTARYKNRGRALLLLLPNEATGMLPLLHEANMPIVEKHMNPNKQQSVQRKLQALLAGDAELKLNAQRAVKSYVRSVYLQPDKHIFDVKKVPIKAFSQSLGLMAAPRIKNIYGIGGESARAEHRALKNIAHGLAKLDAMLKEDDSNRDKDEDTGNDDEDVMELIEKIKFSKRNKTNKTKVERLLSLKASGPVAQAQLFNQSEDESSSGDLSEENGLVFKSSQKPINDAFEEENEHVDIQDLTKVASKSQLKRIKISRDGVIKGRARPSRKVFDGAGVECSAFAKLRDESGADGDEVVDVSLEDREGYLERVRLQLQKEDSEDKLREKERIKRKRLEAKRKDRQQNENRNTVGESGVTLGSATECDEQLMDAENDVQGSCDDELDRKDDGKRDIGYVNTRSAKRSKIATKDTKSMEAEALRMIAAQRV